MAIADYVATLGLNTKGAIRNLQRFDRQTASTTSDIKKDFNSVGRSIQNAVGDKNISVKVNTRGIGRQLQGLKNKFKTGFSINTAKLRTQIGTLKSKLSNAFIKAGEVAKRSLGGIRRLISSITSSISSIAFTGLAIGGAGIFGANKAIEQASDLKESINAVESTFKSNSKAILEFGKTADRTVGLSQSRFNELAVVLRASLSNAGFSGDELNAELIKITKRASDVSSLFNIGVDEVMTKFLAAFRGEADPIESLGVIINANALQQEATAKGISKAVTKMNEAEKIQLRIAGVIRQTNDADGDFLKTIGDLANLQRSLRARYVNIASDIGSKLLPIKLKIVKAFEELTTQFEKFLENFDSTEMGIKFNAWVAQIDFTDIINKVIKFAKEFDFSAAFKRFQDFVNDIKKTVDDVLVIIDKFEKAFSRFDAVKNRSLGGKAQLGPGIINNQETKVIIPENKLGQVIDRNAPSINRVVNDNSSTNSNRNSNVNNSNTINIYSSDKNIPSRVENIIASRDDGFVNAGT